jgi:2-polyprenyl-3-methyl-5-hydroxy-6-metoxy-1,4-benzoquinol methylase
VTHDQSHDHSHGHSRGHSHGHSHGPQGAPGRPGESPFTQEFWDERYGSADQIWSGKPNSQLVAQVSSLPPGRALDAGCGEGADAIWLAGRGWSVTAVDVSVVALHRGAARAAAVLGADDATRITWQQADLLSWDPPAAEFDLVTAQYMHAPDYTGLHRRLAQAVRPGGTFLAVAHHAEDLPAPIVEHSTASELRAHAAAGHGDGARFPTTEQMRAALDGGDWQIVVADAPGRDVKDLNGNPVIVRDMVLRATRRLPG